MVDADSGSSKRVGTVARVSSSGWNRVLGSSHASGNRFEAYKRNEEMEECRPEIERAK